MRKLACLIGQWILALRYKVRVEGLDSIKPSKAGAGILFLATHPAMIDPVILYSRLWPRFRLRALGDEDQVSRPFVRRWADWFGVVRLPDVARYGSAARDGARRSIEECGRLLASGQNLLVYPGGRIMRDREERLGGNSGVEKLLQAAPEARVVLIRTRGLWGSVFSRGGNGGDPPPPRTVAKRIVKTVLGNALFFAPRRPVDIVLWEPDDFPKHQGRRVINPFIESFFNDNAPPNTFVPYVRWEKGGVRIMPEPGARATASAPDSVAPGVKALVLEKIADLTGKQDVRSDQSLANDLGLDSLSRLDLCIWIEKEFGFSVSNPDMLETVADVFEAAAGQGLAGQADRLSPAPDRWFAKAPRPPAPLRIPDAATLTDAFLRAAAAHPDAVIVADSAGSVRTYRDLITGLFVLRPLIAAMPGDYVGIMLPAAPAAGLVWLAVLFAGKTPVMVNWTVGERQINHMTTLLDIQRVLTSRKLVEKLAAQGVRFGKAEQAFACLEDLAGGVSLFRKLRAKLGSFLSWRALRDIPVGRTAVVLFTSGSESLPKAVPLTHGNLLANARDVLAINALNPGDVVLGFLPPFHSFGLSMTAILPLLVGLRTVFHPNPAEGAMLARIVHRYKATIMLGTPTFLNGILKGAAPDDLATLRFAVTGAEKCPAHVYEGLQKLCPNLTVLEGYGITECSPVVSVNRPDRPVPRSIGRIMDSLEYAIVNEETGAPCAPGETGMLLVRGPSIFEGYLRHDGPSPFAEHDGKTWYRTGDRILADETGTLFFQGRLKRFVKLGGEMISLPAIEEVLAERFGTQADSGPALAVESPDEDAPEITLYAVRDISRDEANQTIRDAGLSSLHNIRAVVRVEAIPVLGTGKTDYRALKTLPQENPA